MEARVIYLTSLSFPLSPGVQPAPCTPAQAILRPAARKVPSNVTEQNFFVSDRASSRVQ